MEWINIKDKHFIDVEIKEDGSYTWEENNNTPSKPFLVGTFINDFSKNKIKFIYVLVVVTENGLEAVTDDEQFCMNYEIIDFEYWVEIKEPKQQR